MLQQLIVILIKEDEKESDGEPDFAGIQAINHALILKVVHILRHKRCHYDSLVINDSLKNYILHEAYSLIKSP